MSESLEYRFPVLSEADGTPLTGLSLTLATYTDESGASVAVKPTIAELANEPGTYAFTFEAAFRATGTVRSFSIDLGLTSARRTWWGVENGDDYVASGSSGSGSQAIVFQALVSAVGVPGVRIDAFAGATLMGSGYTDTAGNVTLNLDPGSYAFRATLTGYAFPETPVVVTATNTATPSSVTGSVLSSSTAAPVGLTGTLTWGLTADGQISGVYGATDQTVTRSVESLPAAMTKAWLTFKRRRVEKFTDAEALVQLEITTALTAAGQITDAGGGGTGALSFTLTTAQMTALAENPGGAEFDVKVLAGTVAVLERGAESVRFAVTRAVA